MQSKKILLTAARSYLTLDLARFLHAAGHRIYVADTTKFHVCRFSNSVKKSFLVPSPRQDADQFVDAILKIVEEQKIDQVIPVFEEIIYLSKEQHRFPKHCTLFCSSFELLHELHHKWLFSNKLKALGIETPKTHLISTQQELEELDYKTTSYALKASYSRGSSCVKKIQAGASLPNVNIEPQNPWIAQEWLAGDKFCTYSICQNGAVKAHAVYPVNYAINGNSCLTFEAIPHPGILKWVENFVKAVNFTGQIAFDFIELPNNKLYAIECNPRATSGLHLFKKNDRIDQAFQNENSSLIVPQVGFRKQIAIGMLMYGWKKTSLPRNSISRFLKTLFSIKDVVFTRKDLKPFFSTPFIFVSLLIESRKRKLSIPVLFNYDNEWNG